MGAEAAEARSRPDIGPALMDAVDSIADMAQRVQLNGPEVTYVSEKLGFALYNAAEGLALCGVEIDEITEEVCKGHEHGKCVTGTRDREPCAPVPFVLHPVSREDARLRVTSANGSVALLAAHAGGAAGIQLTANEARVVANVLNSAARRLEGRP